MATKQMMPQYEVEALHGKVDRTITQLNEDGSRTAITKSVPAGYMVYFAKGHSIRVADDKELERLGYNTSAPLEEVDIDDNDAGVSSPKEMVLRKTKYTGRTRDPLAELEGAN